MTRTWIKQRFGWWAYDVLFLLLCTLNLLLAILFLSLGSSGEQMLLYLPLWSVVQGLAVLLVAWMALGGPERPWRIVVGFIFLYAVIWSTTAVRWELAEWMSRFLVWTVFHGLILLLIIRLFGWRVYDAEDEALKRTVLLAHAGRHYSDGTKQAKAKYQFSLANMFAWMIALAVVLGTLRGIPPMSTGRMPGMSIQDVLPLYGMAVLAPFLVWAALGTSSQGIRCTSFVIVVVLVSLGCYGLFLIVSAAIWTVLLLLLVRVAGYRFSRQPTSVVVEESPL